MFYHLRLLVKDCRVIDFTMYVYISVQYEQEESFLPVCLRDSDKMVNGFLLRVSCRVSVKFRVSCRVSVKFEEYGVCGKKKGVCTTGPVTM